jgi:hypothetical protein
MGDYFAWLGEEEELTSEALTVRAQNLPANDRDRLVMDVFFPPTPVDSIKLRQISTIDFRPAADRREWNARGRKIPTRTPPMEEIEMIPIESTYDLDEYEIQRLLEPISGNEAIFRGLMQKRIPQRTDGLVFANRRRFELDAAEAWANKTITAMNPQLGHTQTLQFDFDAARHTTAGTAWNDAGVNAYDEFLAWVRDGIDAMRNGVIGAVMRRATHREIVRDAPQGLLGVPLTEAETQRRIQDALGIDFQFYLLENSIDEFIDGGLETTRVKVWPAEKVALVPTGMAVGIGARAPVARAYGMARESGGRIDVRGTAVFRETRNGGRGLIVEAQDNHFPMPDEQNLWVIDAGV